MEKSASASHHNTYSFAFAKLRVKKPKNDAWRQRRWPETMKISSFDDVENSDFSFSTEAFEMNSEIQHDFGEA